MAVTKVTIKTELIADDGYRIEVKKGDKDNVILQAAQLTQAEAIYLLQAVVAKAL
jgi:hypothetical protein